MPALDPEVAKLAALYRTLPTAVLRTAAGASGTVDLTSVTPTDGGGGHGQDLRGRYVWLVAEGADMVLLRKGSAPTTATVGLPLRVTDPPLEIFIDRTSSLTTIAYASAGSARLQVLWDHEVR